MAFFTRSIILLFCFSLANLAQGSHHGWVISEVFSNSDGTLQFVEMRSTRSGENVGGFRLVSNGINYTFPNNVANDSPGSNLLLSTADFEGAYGISPDFVIADGFLSVDSGSVDYAFGVSVLNWTMLPTDGVTALGGAAATPRNNAGQTRVLTPLDTTAPVISDVPTSPLEILSNEDVSVSDTQIVDFLEAISCSDESDSSPMLVMDTPASFATGSTTTISITCTDDAGNVADDHVEVTITALMENPKTGLWWNPDESGWGVTLTQQGDIIFVTMFTYESSGIPIWYVASNCAVTEESCSGELYKVVGGASITNDWDAPNLDVSAVGDITFAFSDNDNANMTFTIDAVEGSKDIIRQVFNELTPGDPMTALWWNASESGWGITLNRQSEIAFATMFTYDTNEFPSWYVASNCAVTDNQCSGVLYEVTGGAAITDDWNGANLIVNEVGSITFEFTDDDNGTIEFDINDIDGSKTITRQVFN